MGFRGFIPAEWCLSCKRCCRFGNPSDPWVPVFSLKEIEEVLKKGFPPSSFNKEDVVPSVDVRVRLKDCGDFYCCPFFDVGKNCCLVYPVRSFDCKLYPFLLIRKSGKIFLGIDRDCPYVAHLYQQEEEWRIFKFVDYLVDWFSSDEGRDEVSSHPSMIANYPGNVLVLRELKL